MADLKGVTGSLNAVAPAPREGGGHPRQDDDRRQPLHAVSTPSPCGWTTLAARMESGEGSLGRLLKDPEFYDNLNGAAKDVRALVTDVRKDPSKYLRVQVEGVLI